MESYTLHKKKEFHTSSVPKPQFDLTPSAAPCQYFKSSFARSLSFSNNKTKSLEFCINFERATNNGPPSSSSRIKSPEIINAMISDNNDYATTVADKLTLKRKSSTNWNDTNKYLISPNKNHIDFKENEILRLRKQCQALIAENRRLQVKNVNTAKLTNGIEALCLQNQIDTLEWQLKQVESSRQMYRVLLEEITKFLGKCHQCLDKSKCEHTPHPENAVQYENVESFGTPRAMSITNLINCPRLVPAPSQFTDHPEGSYHSFGNFTCRREPKTINLEPNSCSDSEKLSQEAFRLYRTAQNLLKTREPILNLSKANVDYPKSKSNTESTHSLETPLMFATQDCRLHRNSHTSYTTEDSVHSVSSTKSETEDDIQEHVPALSITHSHLNINRCKYLVLNEDESGFSSMNSFKELGLPIVNSTMISTLSTSSTSSNDAELDATFECKGELSSLFLPAQNVSISVKNDFTSLHNHRRCESMPGTLPTARNKTSTFSTLMNGNESVLWV